MPKSNYGEFMITEKDIKASITKHFVKTIVLAGLMTILMQFINNYFFDEKQLSPLLIVIISISGCLYIIRKVMSDLFVLQQKTDKQ